MTKKKALIYLIIFIVAVTAAQLWKNELKKNPAEKFNAMCNNVLAPSCQVYLNKITKEKKYKEAVEIQQERIRQNKQVLGIYKLKTSNKLLLFKNTEEVNKELIACINTSKCKKDYFLIKVSDDTIRDIVLDSLIISEIQQKELNDSKAALKTIKQAKYIVKTNRFFYARKEALKEINKQIEELKTDKQKAK